MTQYALPIDGNAYYNTKVKHLTWDSATDDDKNRALIEATRLIDHLNFEGCRHDSTQVLEFPRGNDTVVPTDIMYACIEIANAILDGYDPEIAVENLNTELIAYAGVHLRSDRTSVPVHLVNQIPSIVAWNFIRPYLRDPSRIVLSRIQ